MGIKTEMGTGAKRTANGAEVPSAPVSSIIGGNVPDITSPDKTVTCTIRGVEYNVRLPKAKDMIAIEKRFKDYKDSNIMQALLLVSSLSVNGELTLDFLEDLYMDELKPVIDLTEKLLPSM